MTVLGSSCVESSRGRISDLELCLLSDLELCLVSDLELCLVSDLELCLMSDTEFCLVSGVELCLPLVTFAESSVAALLEFARIV